MTEGVIGKKTLNARYGHRLGYGIQNAGVLAVVIGGANTGANLGHAGGRTHDGSGLQKPTLSSEQHPLGDGIAEGAARDATGVGALDATAGLLAGGLLVEDAVDLEKVMDPLGDGPLWGFLPDLLTPSQPGIGWI